MGKTTADLKITTISDINDILRLYPEADTERKAKIRSDILKDIEDAEKGNRIIYGAMFNGNIVGTMQLIFKMEKDYYADGKNRVHLHHARVSEELRGKGIGSQLVRVAEDEARRRELKEITLGVEETNTKAIKLYEKLGYREFMWENRDEGEVIIGMKKIL